MKEQDIDDAILRASDQTVYQQENRITSERADLQILEVCSRLNIRVSELEARLATLEAMLVP